MIISKLGCPCCVTVYRLLTSEKYYNMDQTKVLEIIDCDEKTILHSIRDENGNIKEYFSDKIRKDTKDHIADTYPCVLKKMQDDKGTYFKYLPEGKDGMLTRFTETIRETHPNIYFSLVENLIRNLLTDKNAQSKLIFDYVQSQLKPDENELNLIVEKLKKNNT